MSKSKSELLSKAVRIDVLNMINHGHGAHIGSAFSIADIIPVLYISVLKFDVKNPDSPSRDIFILSKGHAGATLYATLAEIGFFEKSILMTYEDDGSLLCGHVTKHNVPGVEVSTGSLGHGASIAAGYAHAFKMDGKKNHVYCLIGDGESEEGEIWEMAMYSAHYQLDNLTIIIDSNKQQALGNVDEIMSFSKNQNKRWESFGFDVVEIDGHNHQEIKKALLHRSSGKPVAIIANTIKGKGVSFMEDSLLWHYKNPDGEFYLKALEELKKD
ncbi:MAG: transketolase [Bacilli bacterium]